MPSAFECNRSYSSDLQSLKDFSIYRYTSRQDRELANRAGRVLPDYFKRYWSDFQKPRKLLLRAKSKDIAPFLYGLYSSKSKPFKYIDELRDSEDIGACLYCGMQKNITVDHYLPRDLNAFPHLSFLTFNLVLACSSCQSSKNNFYPKPSPNGQRIAKYCRQQRRLESREGIKQQVSKNRTRISRKIQAKKKSAFFKIKETRRIIHPYFDRFLKKTIYDLFLSWQDGTPRIEKIMWSKELTRLQRSLLAFHAKKLKVKDRSKGFLKRLHSAFSETVVEKNLNQRRIKELIEVMLSQAEKEAKIANSMKAAYFRALLHDETQHAILAEKASGRKESLVREARAIAIRAEKKYSHKIFGI